ncbi:hypothetical protein PG991_005519 [Apiospora marii]|uniref:Uncharacterized protein n=1 Tax=Apiospora marii TaxID=335849 RepID=A0ABR1S9E3_9PEZI
MDIQPPPNVDVLDWPFRKDSRIGSSQYSKPTISKQFIRNKLWCSALLMQRADDCGFVGFDTEGQPDGEAPTQIGLAYLPGLPTTANFPPLLGSIRRLKNRLEGCQMRCISIKNGPHDPQLNPGGRCNYAINTTVDASEVQMQLVDSLFEWKMKNKKKFMVLVGFQLSMDMYTLLSQWPVVLNFLDGWVDTRELAIEKIDLRRQFPSTRPKFGLRSTPRPPSPPSNQQALK